MPTNEPNTKAPAVNEYLQRLHEDSILARDTLTATRANQRKQAAKKRTQSITYEAGDWVMYKRRTYKKGPGRKLQDLWRGPYQILGIDAHGNATLALPKRLKIHPVFATDKLKLYHLSPNDPRRKISPKPAKISSDQEYEVEKILDHRTDQNTTQYLIKWVGYDSDDNTWEPAENLENAAEKLSEYQQNHVATFALSTINSHPIPFY
jgi:hypothetical protein